MSSPTWPHCEAEQLQNKKLRLKDLDGNMTSMWVNFLRKKIVPDFLLKVIQLTERRSSNSLRAKAIISNESIESSTNISIVCWVATSASMRSNGTPELQGSYTKMNSN